MVSKLSPETCLQIIWKRICTSFCDTNGHPGLEKYFQALNSSHRTGKCMAHGTPGKCWNNFFNPLESMKKRGRPQYGWVLGSPRRLINYLSLFSSILVVTDLINSPVLRLFPSAELLLNGSDNSTTGRVINLTKR